MDNLQLQSELSILLNVCIATFLTAFIGVERESAHKPAGIRTNMIVGGAACLIVSITVPLVDFIEMYYPSSLIRTDPIRVLEAVVLGVSFIGAGTIIKEPRGHVIGLTTAATLLYCCAVGIATALEQYVLAAGVVFLVIFINYGLRIVVNRFFGGDQREKE